VDYAVYLQVFLADAHPQRDFAALCQDQPKPKMLGGLVLAQSPAHLFGGQALDGFGL
jgi:hypothetical protein